ncbi:MAG TPA: PIN domain-containing protein [Pyrinomonadaceae bacterium]|nr:PIN domain-containing protein [Pyrinomonadaceae bacterium]
MEYISLLISRYRSKGALIDTNLLLLYFVGAGDPNRISRFKRTNAFTIDEFWLLVSFYNKFERIVTTPNILTEVSNLLGQLSEGLRSSFYEGFSRHIPALAEFYTPSSTISAATHFSSFGLTDSGITNLVKDKYLVLTDDLRLAHYLESREIDVINFNHLRQVNW